MVFGTLIIFFIFAGKNLQLLYEKEWFNRKKQLKGSKDN